MEVIISELRGAAPTYTPNEDVNGVLRDTILLPTASPICVGKSTRIRHIVEAYPDFGRSVGFTTRPRREGEPEDQYDFRPHTAATVTAILEDVQQGRLVQYAVHPNGYIYGSTAKDYASPFTLLDVVYSGMESLDKLPVKGIVKFGLACEPGTWNYRFNNRPTNTEDIGKRLAEGVRCIEWLLDQSDIAWIDTTARLRKPAVQDWHTDEVVAIARGKRDPNPRNRRVGERLLSAIRYAHNSYAHMSRPIYLT